MYFIILNLLATWLAWRFANWIGPRDGVIAWLLALASGFLLVCAGAVWLAGVTGFLRPFPVALLLAIAAGAVALACRKTAFAGSVPLQLAGSRIGLWACGGLALAMIVQACGAGTGFYIDDFGYHAVAVASWIRTGAFGQIMPQFTAYLPLNTEMFAAWFALPLHNDAWVALEGLYWLALAALSVAGLGRLNGLECGPAALLAACVLASATLQWLSRTFASTDLAGSALLLAGAYFATLAARNACMRKALLAGLLVGYAAGCKVTFVPIPGIICLSVAIGPPSPARWRMLATALLACAITGSWWYLRNWHITGNPLFPAQLGPFAGPFRHRDQDEKRLWTLLFHIPWTPRLWTSMALAYLTWPLPLGLLAAAGYIAAIIGEFRRPRQNRALPRLLFTAGLLSFVGQLFAPFCLGGGYVNGTIDVYNRYIIPTFLCGLVLYGGLLCGPTRRALFFRLATIAALLSCWPHAGLRAFIALAGAALGAWLSFSRIRHLSRPAFFAALCGFWLILAALTPRQLRATDRNATQWQGKNAEPLAPVLAALEQLPPGSRVTRFSNHAYFNVPIFGRRWQFDGQFVAPDGSLLPPLHQAFQANPAPRRARLPAKPPPVPYRRSPRHPLRPRPLARPGKTPRGNRRPKPTLPR